MEHILPIVHQQIRALVKRELDIIREYQIKFDECKSHTDLANQICADQYQRQIDRSKRILRDYKDIVREIKIDEILK